MANSSNTFKKVSSSGIVIPGEGVLEGMYVNSTSGGSIVLYNSPSGAADVGVGVGGTITPSAGYHYLGNLHATAGIYCSITGLPVNITFHIKES